MIISGLQPETSYSLTVTAYTTKGDGARSKPKLVSTTGAGNYIRAYLFFEQILGGNNTDFPNNMGGFFQIEKKRLGCGELFISKEKIRNVLCPNYLVRHLTNIYLSIYYVSDTIPITRDTAVNKLERLCSPEIYFLTRTR